MSKMNDSIATWRAQLTERAEELDREAAVVRLIALAEDPLDGIAIASDLVAVMQYVAAATTTPPVLSSSLFRRAVEALAEKLVTVVEILSGDEQRRLGALAPRFLESVAAAEPDVITAVVDLLPMSPELIAFWLQIQLRTIEARFAS